MKANWYVNDCLLADKLNDCKALVGESYSKRFKTLLRYVERWLKHPRLADVLALYRSLKYKSKPLREMLSLMEEGMSPEEIINYFLVRSS